jgi:hypothetical protein
MNLESAGGMIMGWLLAVQAGTIGGWTDGPEARNEMPETWNDGAQKRND